MRLFALSLAIAIAGCGTPGTTRPASSTGGATSPRISAGATPSPGVPRSVWVLTPLGLNVRSDASTQAPRVTTAPEGTQLDVSESRTVDNQLWLHVKTPAGNEGWVLNDPTLVISVPVYMHIDTALGYRIMFPQSWTITSGNPTSFASPPSDPQGAVMSVQQAADVSKLLQTPTSAGKEIRQESPIEVYGKTTFMTVYQLSSGGFEYAVKVQWAADRAYLFDYRQVARPQPDASLFKQLLISIAIA